MSLAYIHYELLNGFVHNWLVAGPQAIAIDDHPCFGGEEYSAALVTELRQQIVRDYHEEGQGFTGTPVERGLLTEGTFQTGDFEAAWDYFRCHEDHFIDQAGYYPTCHYLRSWAYTELVTRRNQDVWLLVTSCGPADLWVNGTHIQHLEHFCDRQPSSVPVEVKLRRGANQFLARFENIAIRECPHILALQVCKSRKGPGSWIPASEMHVRLPTMIENVERRNRLEQVFEEAYLDREVFIRDDRILVRWPESMDNSAITSVRLQTPSGRIYAEAQEKGSPGDLAFLGRAGEVPPGPYRAILMPSPREYYEGNQRIRRELHLWSAGNHAYSQRQYGTQQERRMEALTNASRREGGLFSEIAKMALGRWAAVETGVVLEVIHRIQQRQEDSSLDLVGLLGMLYRFGGKAEFPPAMRQPLEDCLLNFRYWHDEPGQDGKDYSSESRQILFHTCEVLAGQLYPDRTFANSGQNGEWHREKGQRLALAWLYERGAWGFGEWGSPESFAEELVALSHLIDLAESEQLWELASVVMDKIFLTIGINSFQGVFGSSHGRASSQQVKGGLLEATSGITRLMWGLGVFNHHLAGPISLACMERYELPAILSNIAAALPQAFWSRERHASPTAEGEMTGCEVNLVTYKTPDTMLCSAQGYHPGEAGSREHLWQATLGPGAVVFVTHPACSHEGELIRPNFWLGNALLPRVAQWEDALIAIHNLPDKDWMGFTHAYFPTYAFEEWILKDGWAFARQGNGYLALSASQGFRLITRGHSAYRELRSEGRNVVWLCHMGRAALDGDFANFQAKILALPVVFGDLSVQWNTLRGDSLSFGWTEPFSRNEQEQPLGGFRHYENPYMTVELPCKQMDIRFGDELLRLDFQPPDTEERT